MAQSTQRQNPLEQGDGFTQARGPRRGTQTQPRTANVTTRDLTVEASRNNRGTIALANKFGSLEMVTSTGALGEDAVNGEENKANHDMNIQNKKGKGVLHGKETLIFGGNTSASTSSKVGAKVKGAGNKKVMGEGRGREKKLNNRPVRGLVFGPTKGEVSLSESGKRLRVESTDVGRLGGVFGDRGEEAQITSRLQLQDEELENPLESIISETEQQETDILSNPQGDERVLSVA